MPSSPIGRRGFLAGAAAGGAALVTLGGIEYHADAKLDVEAMGSQMRGSARRRRLLPPSVTDGLRRRPPVPAAGGGLTREYWIKAVKVPNWDIVPTHRDGMMDRPIKGKTKITAIAYQRFHPGFKKPMGQPSIPGPLIEADVGDTVVINFRNECGMPVTMHPHGIFYTVDMDGTYKGKYTDARRVRRERAHVPLHLGGASGHGRRVALPRPRPDGSDPGVQGPVRIADRP